VISCENCVDIRYIVMELPDICFIVLSNTRIRCRLILLQNNKYLCLLPEGSVVDVGKGILNINNLDYNINIVSSTKSSCHSICVNDVEITVIIR